MHSSDQKINSIDYAEPTLYQVVVKSNINPKIEIEIDKIGGLWNLRVFNMKNQWGIKNALICRDLAW